MSLREPTVTGESSLAELKAALAQVTRERDEALEQQAASAAVLKAISRSAFDLQAVLDTLLETACRLCEADIGTIRYEEGVGYRLAATYGCQPEWREHFAGYSSKPDRSSVFGQTILKGGTVHIPDVLEDADYARPVAQKLMGLRAALGVPLVRDGRVFGVINLFRTSPRAFAQRQIDLVETFATQATIAIENARLFDTVQERTRELSESLQQQTATSEVLQVISGSLGALEPVFDAMLEKATRLCGATFGIMSLYEGGAFRVVAMHNPPPAFAELRRREPVIRPGPMMRMAASKGLIHIADITEHAAAHPGDEDAAAFIKLTGVRTILGVPMLKDGELVGAIVIYRNEVQAFGEKQIELMTNFAAQAVIAIENARLLNELRETLERQTATSQVLQVISSSPGELEPVFQAMLENATRICEAKIGILWAFENGAYSAISMLGISPEYAEYLKRGPIRAGPTTGLGRVASTKQTVHIADTLAEQAYADRDPFRVATAEVGRARTLLNVPMIKDGELIGAIGVYRQEVRPFTDKQVELVTNFAAQAVIAIENARLLNELRESLQRQTATSEVLEVISSSPGQLDPVFETMLENATRICEAKLGTLFLLEDETYRAVAVHGDSYYADWFRREPVVDMRSISHAETPLHRLMQTKMLLHIHDLREEVGYRSGNPRMKALVETAGARTHLVVPMLKDEELVGAITIYRTEVRPFSDKQIELVQNFAAQAVIAIENTRLLNELRQRTDDLTESLEQQTASGEILASISASMADTKPVFEAIVRNLKRLFGTRLSIVQILQDDGTVHLAATGEGDEFDVLSKAFPRPLDDTTGAGRAMLTKKVVQFAPIIGDPDAPPSMQAFARQLGFNATIFAPMLRDGKVIGAVGVAREEAKPFTEKQVELIRTFAAQAVIAIENTRLFNELRQRTDDLTESLEQQTAISEILRVISSSPSDVQPVLDSVAEHAARICEAQIVDIVIVEGDRMRISATFGDLGRPETRELMPLNRATVMGRSICDMQPVQVEDLQNAADDFAVGRDLALKFGHRTILAVPLLRERRALGTILVRRTEVNAFKDKHIALLTTFADQAAIAIENVRLFDELRQRTDDLAESLEQQTATAEVLSVMSRSKFDLAPVLQSVVDTAAKLCRADQAVIFRLEDGLYRFATGFSLIPEYLEIERANPIAPGPGTAVGRAAMSRAVVRIEDAMSDAGYAMKEQAAIAHLHSIIGVPLLRDGEPIGVIALARCRIEPFSDREVELVTTFADQAVIAIENVRLFEEVQARTEDLQESLEQQTATAEVLSVMSRSKFDLGPILQSVVDTAAKLCRAEQAAIYRLEDGAYRLAAFSLDSQHLEIEKETLYRAGAGTVVGRAAMTRQAVQIEDVLVDPLYQQKDEMRAAGIRSVLGVPLMRDGEAIGVIGVARFRVEPFTGREIELVTTFTDQAVIAIENVRLFEEVQARTEDLQESLQQQTATADVLKVISRSTFDLQTVFDALIESAAKLCRADRVSLRLLRDGAYHSVALHGYSPEHDAYMKSHPAMLGPSSLAGRAVLAGKPVQVEDITKDSDLSFVRSSPGFEVIRTLLGVPLLREGAPIGVLILSRERVELFSDREIDLVTTFADQAVIAIENVRLFEEVQARTEDLAESLQQQTATADVLKVISRSTFDLKTVLDTLVESASRLCEADKGAIMMGDESGYWIRANFGFSDEAVRYSEEHPLRPSRGSVTGRVVLEGRSIHIPDVLADPEYNATGYQQTFGYRTNLGVPLLREGKSIGVFTLTRDAVNPFTDKQIDLVSTFADQAVIAIENVRLFDEIQEKSRQLEEASRHKSQFLANMSHELRTPLNAILGYTELIVDGVYGETPEKVQAALKRITTNGKHLLGLINDVLDLSKIEAGQLTLSLTDYSMKDVVHSVYGAVEPLAAEKKLAFKAEIAPEMPVGHGDERRLTQVLLNLVGNAIKFTDEGEVKIKAAASDGHFSVAVVDTGPGISEDDQKKLFQEFQQADSSTTKKKGGTGLGLAISKKIIEMHGGSVRLDSKLGKGSTFSFTVPLRAEQVKKQP
jgi:GAF domain-containing protein